MQYVLWYLVMGRALGSTRARLGLDSSNAELAAQPALALAPALTPALTRRKSAKRRSPTDTVAPTNVTVRRKQSVAGKIVVSDLSKQQKRMNTSPVPDQTPSKVLNVNKTPPNTGQRSAMGQFSISPINDGDDFAA